MQQHHSHLKPDSDCYNLGQWIETVPHAYDLTLQPEIDLTRDLIRGLFELATAPAGQELPATVNDKLSACTYSASTTLSKLRRTEGKIASDHPLHGKNVQIGHSFDDQEDFDSLSNEEKVEHIGFLIHHGSHLNLAHEIALTRIRIEQDIARWQQASDPKEAVKIARSVLRGINTVCRLLIDHHKPVPGKVGGQSDFLWQVLYELGQDWGIDLGGTSH